MHAFILEALHLGILVRVGQWDTQLTSLRTIETSAGDGDAVYHVVTADAVGEFLVCLYHIRCTKLWVPVHMLGESILQSKVAHLISSGIEVEQPIEANALLAYDECTYGGVFLQSTTGANTHNLQRGLLCLLGASSKVDIDQRVQLVDHNIYIVAANASAGHSDALALVLTCD